MTEIRKYIGFDLGAVKNRQEFRKIVANSFELKTYQPDKSSYFDEYEDSYKEILKTN